MSDEVQLTAENLKKTLWTVLQRVQAGTLQAGEADAIASQAREILRTTNTQLRIFHQGKRSVSVDVIAWAEK